jgi:hypothetical protein
MQHQKQLFIQQRPWVLIPMKISPYLNTLILEEDGEKPLAFAIVQ